MAFFKKKRPKWPLLLLEEEVGYMSAGFTCVGYMSGGFTCVVHVLVLVLEEEVGYMSGGFTCVVHVLTFHLSCI